MILDAQPDIEVVAEAGDGFQAVAAVRVHRPDVVLLGIRMPGMDGIEAARIVCAETGCRAVMLTIFDQDDHVFDALRAGASGFLLKDVRRDDLVHAVRVVALGESLLAPSVTRRLVEQFTAGKAARPLPVERLTVLTARERETPDARGGPVQSGDRRRHGRRHAHREDARQQRAHQARPA